MLGRSLDEGNGVLGHRLGVRGDVDLHASTLDVAFVGADVNTNDVRQGPGPTDEDCVVSGKLAAPIAVKMSVDSNASTMPSTTAGPARMLPCAEQYSPMRWPAQSLARGPVWVATSPRAFMIENWRPSFVQRSGSGSGSRARISRTASAGEYPSRSSASAWGP